MTLCFRQGEANVSRKADAETAQKYFEKYQADRLSASLPLPTSVYLLQKQEENYSNISYYIAMLRGSLFSLMLSKKVCYIGLI